MPQHMRLLAKLERQMGEGRPAALEIPTEQPPLGKPDSLEEHSVESVPGGVITSWIALPKRPNLPAVNQLVVDPFRTDYFEAWTILEDSPRMSAVLSRRLLADLLEKYAGLNQWSLTQRIDAFVADTRYPQWLRQNLHYVREAGDFGAHKQEDLTTPTAAPQQPPPEPVIIDVSEDEAKWTLKTIADLFEYLIVGPEKDKEMRAALDKKIADAKRKPIMPIIA